MRARLEAIREPKAATSEESGTRLEYPLKINERGEWVIGFLYPENGSK